MKIIKKEILAFSEKEVEAIYLVCEICSGLMREATDPELNGLGEDIYNNLSELLAWREEEE